MNIEDDMIFQYKEDDEINKLFVTVKDILNGRLSEEAQLSKQSTQKSKEKTTNSKGNCPKNYILKLNS